MRSAVGNQSGWCVALVMASIAALFAGVWAVAIAASGLAVADDSWNPFAEKDRTTERRAGSRPPVQSNDQRPYLAPLTSDDAPSYRRGVPRPYPATRPDAGVANSYQPPGSVPYGAPGTYVPSPPPGGSAPGTTFGSAAPSVERGELTPVISSAGALPSGTWRGLDAAGAEQLLQGLALPHRSPALAELFLRIVAEPVKNSKLNAIRRDAALRSGRFDLITDLQTNASTTSQDDPVFTMRRARLDLVNGREGQGCASIKQIVAAPQKLPVALRGEAIVTAGYCAVIAGNRKGGSLAAELARDSGYNRPFTLALLEAIGNDTPLRVGPPSRLTTLDGLLMTLLRKADPSLNAQMMQRADPGFLWLIASNPKSNPSLRLAAAEQAAARNITSPATLADAYRSAAGGSAAASGNASGTAALERARQFFAAERQQAQFAKTRAVRALLDSARRDGLYHPVAIAAAPIVRAMQPTPEISWFNETAVEVLAAAGDYLDARKWVAAANLNARGGAGALDHWLMLLDVADPQLNAAERGRNFQSLENLAIQGRLPPMALHRLATVLDALDYNVPVPLWNLASQSQQPQTGHLPATGMMSAMKKASQDGQIAATTLYAMHTVAPAGTSATHLLGLGDTIRAFKRADLEKEARRLGFEALFGDWPRAG